MALDLGELVAFLDLDTSKFDQGVDRMPGSISGKAAAFGAAGLAIGGVIAAAMSKGLSDAISFEDSLTSISGALSLTEAESARVGAAAGRVYAENYGESVEQVQGTVAGIITQIEGMGAASDATVDKMTAKVLNYASAFGFETSEAIAMVQQLMTSGLAGSADEAMDLMTASMQRVPEALRGDLADAVTEYGPLLAQMGFTGQQAFDLLASGADQGMYGIDKAGDALKEFGIKVSDLGDSGAQDALASLGLSGEDMARKVAAGGDSAKGAFDEIVAGLLGMEDPAARANAAIALFGTPLEDLGVAQIPDFLGSLQGLGSGMADTAGAADAMGEKMGSSTASQMEAMNRQVQIMMSDLMSGLLPILTAVFGFLADNPAVIQIIAAALGVLALAFIGVSVATWAMNTALLANPITWIIIAIVALIAALVLLFMNWDSVVKWITEVWSGFMSWIGTVIDGFVGWWNGVWAGFGAWITSVWDGFISWIVGVWGGFVDWLMGIVNGIASWWNGLWSGIGAFFESVWSGLVSWAVSVIAGWIGTWMGIFNGLTGFFSGLWSGIVSTIQSAWNGAMDFLGSIPGRIMGFFGGIGSWLINAGEDLIQGFIDGIGNMIGAVGDAIGGVMDFVGGFFPHSPAERGPFSGSGWRAVMHAGEAISEQFARGLHGSNPFEGYGEGVLAGVVRVQPNLDRRMGELVDTPALAATVNAKASTLADDASARPASSRTVNYFASEDRGLSSEEALFAAMGSPRVTNGKGWG